MGNPCSLLKIFRVLVFSTPSKNPSPAGCNQNGNGRIITPAHLSESLSDWPPNSGSQQLTFGNDPALRNFHPERGPPARGGAPDGMMPSGEKASNRGRACAAPAVFRRSPPLRAAQEDTDLWVGVPRRFDDARLEIKRESGAEGLVAPKTSRPARPGEGHTRIERKKTAQRSVGGAASDPVYPVTKTIHG